MTGSRLWPGPHVRSRGRGNPTPRCWTASLLPRWRSTPTARSSMPTPRRSTSSARRSTASSTPTPATRLFDEPERGAVDQVLKLVRRTGSWTGELTMLASGTSPVAMRTSWTPLGRGRRRRRAGADRGDRRVDRPLCARPAARHPPASARRGDQRAARRRRCRGRLGHRHRPHDEGRRCDVRVPVPPGRRRDARADGTARRPGGDGRPLGDVPGGQQRPHGRERAHGSARAGPSRRRRRALPHPSAGSPTAPARSCASRSWWRAAGSWARCPCPSRDGVRSARPRTSSSGCSPTPAR